MKLNVYQTRIDKDDLICTIEVDNANGNVTSRGKLQGIKERVLAGVDAGSISDIREALKTAQRRLGSSYVSFVYIED